MLPSQVGSRCNYARCTQTAVVFVERIVIFWIIATPHGSSVKGKPNAL